LLQNFK
jgi:hypothetical protein